MSIATTYLRDLADPLSLEAFKTTLRVFLKDRLNYKFWD